MASSISTSTSEPIDDVGERAMGCEMIGEDCESCGDCEKRSNDGGDGDGDGKLSTIGEPAESDWPGPGVDIAEPWCFLRRWRCEITAGTTCTSDWPKLTRGAAAAGGDSVPDVSDVEEYDAAHRA